MQDFTSQSGHDLRLRWGRRGARDAARAGDVLVVVDVLSFSTAAVLGVFRGARVFPSPRGEEAARRARELGAELAVGRDQVPDLGRISLSPGTLTTLGPEDRVVLPSPNGSTCADAGRAGAAAVYAGALVNASVTARLARADARARGVALSVLACGERWRSPEPADEALRVAIEDLYGAGAVLAGCEGDPSPEARLAIDAFRASREELESRLLACASGRELVERGFEADVRLAARLDSVDTAAVLGEDGGFRPAR